MNTSCRNMLHKNSLSYQFIFTLPAFCKIWLIQREVFRIFVYSQSLIILWLYIVFYFSWCNHIANFIWIPFILSIEWKEVGNPLVWLYFSLIYCTHNHMEYLMRWVLHDTPYKGCTSSQTNTKRFERNYIQTNIYYVGW